MDVQAIDQVQASQLAAQSGPAAAAPQVGLAPFPDPSQPAAAAHQLPDGTLHHALSQLVGGGSHVAVQFRVVGQNEIVTVFKNAETGAVITQFPSEAMVLIAQFFNKLAGAVVDRTA
jgi:hypothetical protein